MKHSTKWRWIAVLAVAMIATCLFVGCNKKKPVEEPDPEPAPDTVAPTITLNCKEGFLVAPGSTFTIPADEIAVRDNHDSVVKPTFSVTDAGGGRVSLTGNTFEVAAGETYTVKVSAVDAASNAAEKTLTVVAAAEGEINSFDDALRVSQARVKGVVELSLNTDPQYIREGTGSLKAHFDSHIALGWPGIVVEDLPVNNILPYYSVSFWIFNDGNKDIEIMLNRNEISPKAKFTLKAHVWNKIEVKGRDYDDVFQVYEATDWGEPACGICEDLKSLSFHFVNPENSPAFDLYVDAMRVNKEQVYDTLEIAVEPGYPTVGTPYAMPEVSVSFGGETVDAEIEYMLFDEDNNPVEITENSVTFGTEGRYDLRIKATYNGLTDIVSYPLIVAAERAENEIEFFESETALYNFRSEHFDLSIDRTVHHDRNGSTASLKIAKCPSIWPYLTIGDVPHSDLKNVSYIYFYAKIGGYSLTSTQTAYLGLRDAKRSTVLKRVSLTSEWQGFSFSWEQLYNMGIDSLNGLQLSVELYDTNVLDNGHWVPVAFDTYIDNISVLNTAEPTEKTDGVVLDFDNYRDLDGIDTSWASYEFLDTSLTKNGKGSLKISASGSRWPTVRLVGERFAEYSLRFAKELEIDVLVTNIRAGERVRVGVNNAGYAYFDAAQSGQWTTIKVSASVLINGTLPDDTPTELETLQNLRFTFGCQLLETETDVNFGSTCVYFGGVRLINHELAPGAEDHVKPDGVLYDFYDVVSAKDIKHQSSDKSSTTAIGSYEFFDNCPTSKLVMTGSTWNMIFIPEAADEAVEASRVNMIYLDVYVKTDLEDGQYLRYAFYYWNGSKYTEKYRDSFVPANQWTTIGIPVKEGTEKLSDIHFYIIKGGTGGWAPIGAKEGEALYFREIGWLSDTEPAASYDPETAAASVGMFSGLIDNDHDYAIFRNSDPKFVKEGKYSIGLRSTQKWPAFYFTNAYIAWLRAEGVESISFDLYVDDPNSNLFDKTEGVFSLSKSASTLKLNEWFTLTITVEKLASSSRKLQFDKLDAKTTTCYIDNIVLTKAE